MAVQGAVGKPAWRRNLLLALLAAAVLCAWLRPLDDLAGAQAQAGFKRAVASFATARALNAVISVVQGTEFSVQPLGIGVTLTPGQMLDPLNDLVERFSDLMLVASVAFGVQLLLIEVGMHWGMTLLLSLAAAGWAWQTWQRARAPALLTRVLVALLLVRFIVPAAGMASDPSIAASCRNSTPPASRASSRFRRPSARSLRPTAPPSKNGGSSASRSSSSAPPSTRPSNTPSASSSSSCCRP